MYGYQAEIRRHLQIGSVYMHAALWGRYLKLRPLVGWDDQYVRCF